MKKGFTLIELLVTITIIGILAAAGLTILNPNLQLKKARDSKRKADVVQIQSALEFYRSDIQEYPASLPSCGAALSANGTTYLKSMPCDPMNTGQQTYSYFPSGSPPISYTIVSCLENTKDSQKDSGNNSYFCTGGTTNWSYTITNP